MTKERMETLAIIDTVEDIVKRTDALIAEEQDEIKKENLIASKKMHLETIEKLTKDLEEPRTERRFITQEELEDVFINEGYSIEKAVVLTFRRMVEMVTEDGWKVDYDSNTQTIYKDIVIK